MLSTITNMKFSKFLTLLLQSLVDLKFQTFHIRTLQKNVAEENKKSCKRSHPFFFYHFDFITSPYFYAKDKVFPWLGAPTKPVFLFAGPSFGQALFISSRSMESIFS